jgi:hypothetical protein
MSLAPFEYAHGFGEWLDAERRIHLAGVVGTTVLQHQRDLADVGNVGGWIAIEQHEVGTLADLDRTAIVEHACIFCTVPGRNLQRLRGG